MNLQAIEFIRSAEHPGHYPDDQLPHVAFAGRSNVGKSSLINSLTGRRKIAQTSRTPGRTRHINFFRVDGRLYFVDLPGYGYARVSKQTQEQWRPMMERYFGQAHALRLTIALIDARHGPTDLDLQLLEYLAALEVAILAVSTKIDKLKRAQRNKRLAEITRAIAPYCPAPLPYSSVTHEGRETLATQIADLAQ